MIEQGWYLQVDILIYINIQVVMDFMKDVGMSVFLYLFVLFFYSRGHLSIHLDTRTHACKPIGKERQRLGAC